MFIPQKFGEFLYRYAYPIYKPFYFSYKYFNEQSEIKFISQYIHSGDVVLDIRANIGFYTILFAKYVGKEGKVYAFEPESNNFSKLIKNTAHISQIHPVCAAVSHVTGSIQLYSSDFDLNVDFRTYATALNKKMMNISAYAIDDFVQQNHIDGIQFIKIDIQGYEYQALQGMKHTLTHFKDIKILMEYWPYGLSQAGCHPANLFEFFNQLHYNMFLLQSGQLKPLTKDILANLFFENIQNYSYYSSIFIQKNDI